MTPRSIIGRLLEQEQLNFLLTNRIPRRALTRFMGWFSRIEQPLIRSASIAIWRFFADVDLSDARESHFRSLHACFIRELRSGARPIDPDPGILVSPCDGIVGAIGEIRDGLALQAKGRAYELLELLGDPDLARYYAGGRYVTLRLTAGMYHRFHAPGDCRVEHVTYVPGDTWNVNPATLTRVDRLFCRNERAALRCRLSSTGQLVTLVPVAAILVASIRLQFLDLLLHLDYQGPRQIECSAQLQRGQQMGWFQHGSTILVFAPAGFGFADGITEGSGVRMGQPLLRLPAAAQP